MTGLAQPPPLRFTGPLPPEHFNMARYVIGRAARAAPGRVALLVFDNPDALAPAERWTFQDIETAVLRVAGALKARGYHRGERLLIKLNNTSTYALLFFGAIAAGLVPLATSTHLTEDESSFLLTDSGARVLALADHLPRTGIPADVDIIIADEVAAMMRGGKVQDYADSRADDPAYMVYTSGTSANPKGVLHAQRAAWGRRPMYQGWYGIGSGDRMLHAGAFNWTFTLGSGLTDPWANGATSIIYTGEKTPDVWPHLIARTEATLFAAVPGVYRQILKYADASALAGMATLRHGLMAGEAPPQGLFEAWQSSTGRALHEALGMSEISTYVSSSPSVPRKPGTVGKGQPGRAIAILAEDGGTTLLAPGETGLLAVHASDPGLMLGYWQRPAEEQEVRRGNWFIGGDFASIDADGYVTHLGRANDIMKAMGYRVAPQEVEAVLSRHPQVGEVACGERQVSEGVSIIAAYVVPAAPDVVPDGDALMAYAAEHLAPYKCPRAVRLVERLPRTANGKVLRRALDAAPALRARAG
jgi:acetyl-CoA synthetase